MTPTGIPRRGLVCHHDLYDPTSALQIIPDSSGHGVTLQRGSAAGADSSDPAWDADGKGLVFATDYCITGGLVAPPLNGPWTVIAVLKYNGTSGTPLCLGGDAAHFHRLSHGGAGALMIGTGAGGGENNSAGTVAMSAVSPVAIVWSNTGSLMTLKRVDTGASATLAPLAAAGTAKLGVGTRSDAIANVVDAMTGYEFLLYSCVLTNAETQRGIRAIRAFWSPLGVTIP